MMLLACTAAAAGFPVSCRRVGCAPQLPTSMVAVAANIHLLKCPFMTFLYGRYACKDSTNGQKCFSSENYLVKINTRKYCKMQKVKNPKIQKCNSLAICIVFLNLWIFHLLHLIRLFFRTTYSLKCLLDDIFSASLLNIGKLHLQCNIQD